MLSPSRQARIAGVLYLLLAVSSGLPWQYLNGVIVKRGDASATADNVAAHSSVLRLALVSDLASMACYVLTAMALYTLLKQVNRGIAAAMVAFAATGAAIMGAVCLAQVAALSIATDGSYATAFGPDGSDALLLMWLNLRVSGALIAGVFFGLWLLPMGYLAYRSGYFPRSLGVLLMVGCFSYLVDTVETFLFPGLGHTLSPFVLLPAVVAEVWMVGYLLFKGVRVAAPSRPTPAVA
jgi:hypothetical protein